MQEREDERGRGPEGEAWSCFALSLQLPNNAGGRLSSFSTARSSSSIASNTLARSSAWQENQSMKMKYKILMETSDWWGNQAMRVNIN